MQKSLKIQNMFSDKTQLLVFFAPILVMFLRMHDRFTNGYIWAEDTNIFMSPAYEFGAGSLFLEYAGYLHLLPRTVSYIQSLSGDPGSAPFFFVYACLFITVMSSFYTYKVIFKTTGEKRTSALFAIVPYVFTQSGEIFLNTTNIQWIISIIIPVAMLEVVYFPSKSKIKILAHSILIIVLGLTGPFMIIFSPMFLYLVFIDGKKFHSQTMISGALILATAGVQFYYMSAGSHESMHFSTIPWIQRFFYDFIVHGFIPSKILSKLNNIPIITVIVILSVISLAAAYRNYKLPYILVLFSLLMWVLGVARVGNPDINMSPSGAGARYYFVPYVFLAWSLLLCLKEAPPRYKFAPRTLLILMLITGLSTFPIRAEKKWEVAQSGPDTWEVSAPPGWHATIHVKK